MTTDTTTDTTDTVERHEFKAEIQQVLDILIHSLYTEQEIFLRELISNASDALNRLKFESLTRDILDPEAELAIWISADPENNTITIRDTGIGMTQEDMRQNLGTIAHSGAKSFLQALKEAGSDAQGSTDVIGQFGVGFYSVFMVAEEVVIRSRSFQPEAQGAQWRSQGQGSYELAAADVATRGTSITITLKEDAKEFAQNYRLRQIIKSHSDFVAFPIYIQETVQDNDAEAETAQSRQEWQQVNQQTALWRQPSRDIEAEQYKNFYQQLTFDFQEPLRSIHFTADVPIQFYALLYVPSRRDYRMFAKDDHGLKLYARKVLIRENFKELLPSYLRFIEGVVDSEDIPLNVSRESVQATPMLQKIRKVLVGRIASELGKLASEDPARYRDFYREFGAYIKEGIASDYEYREKFLGLLRFSSSHSQNAEEWFSLDDYVSRMQEEQKEIYYLLGDSYDVVNRSAHLEYFNKHKLEVLYLTDPMDSFMLMGLQEYQDKVLKNIDDADLNLPSDPEEPADDQDSLSQDAFQSLLARVKSLLADKVEDVRESKVLRDSPCRLSSPAGGAAANMQRAQRLLGQDSSVPKKILELNRHSEMVRDLAQRLEANSSDPLIDPLIEQLYENELLMEGLHPNPAEMIPRIQRLMAAASKRS